jgi:hypothetical protein
MVRIELPHLSSVIAHNNKSCDSLKVRGSGSFHDTLIYYVSHDRVCICYRLSVVLSCGQLEFLPPSPNCLDRMFVPIENVQSSASSKSSGLIQKIHYKSSVIRFEIVRYKDCLQTWGLLSYVSALKTRNAQNLHFYVK